MRFWYEALSRPSAILFFVCLLTGPHEIREIRDHKALKTWEFRPQGSAEKGAMEIEDVNAHSLRRLRSIIVLEVKARRTLPPSISPLAEGAYALIGFGLDGLARDGSEIRGIL
jgi:hypothetical protein